jgi:Uma2 family endonuclease
VAAEHSLGGFLARPATDPPEEYRGGTVVPKPPLAASETWLRSDMATLLFGWARAGQQGAVAASTRFVLGESVFVPDVAYFAPGRRPETSTAGVIAIAPDLAVDVCPGATDPAWFVDRAGEYLARGVRQAWVLDAGTESVVVLAAGVPPRTVDKGSVLEAPDLLPGFYVHLDDLFEALSEDNAESG